MKYEEKVELYQFYKELEKFDWYYEMSDDHRVWQAGKLKEKQLIQRSMDPPAVWTKLRLFYAYELHKGSGKPFGTTLQPKPVCPVDESEIEEEDRS